MQQQPDLTGLSVYPTTSPAFTNWYPPQVRPAYEDYYDSKSGGIPTAYSDYYGGCEGDCDCYGPCGMLNAYYVSFGFIMFVFIQHIFHLYIYLSFQHIKMFSLK